MSAAIQRMGINHGGAHVLMSEQFLNGSDIVAPFDQVRGKTMPQRVRRRRLGYSGSLDDFFHGPVQ